MDSLSHWESLFYVYGYYLKENSSQKFHDHYCLMMFLSGKDPLEILITFLWGAYSLCPMKNKTKPNRGLNAILMCIKKQT